MNFTFEMYQKNGGTLSEDEFNSLIYSTVETILFLIDDYVPYWKLELINLADLQIEKAVVIQLEFLNAVGGTGALNGQSSLDLSSIETSGFTLNYGSKNASNGVTSLDDLKIKGVPFSPLAKSIILRQLRLAGLLQRGIA